MAFKKTPDTLLKISQAIREGISLEEIRDITKWDIWFLEQIFQIVHIEKSITEKNLNDKEFLYKIKSLGFTDARISKLSGICEEEILNIRKSYNILPSFKRIDTCAAEFSSQTAYLYSSL